MTEEPKRLKPRPETLRELFLKSGNLCAFPNCTALMMNHQGVFIGQLCHIEAAEEGGQRFNPDMSNEDRRATSNLMLMCYEHHRVTDDVDEYPVSRLQKIKQEHERRFSNPDRAILERLTDWTTTEQPTTVKNLRRMNEVLEWDHTDGDLELSVNELNQFIEMLQRVPIDVRRFVGAVAKRAYLMRNSLAVRDEGFGTNLLVSDFKSSHRVGDSMIRERIAQMESYGIGDVDEINTNMGPQPSIRLRTLDSGWPIWMDIAQFCETTNTPIENFAEELDFSPLDG